jgi:Zn-dependent peptidase ImmA (M78 family)
MPTFVDVNPELVRWAVERSGLARDELAPDFNADWETGKKSPTLRQLEAFARRTMTPLGYLFLPKPPEEKLPIPDFRTPGDVPLRRPSPNLIETIQTMQRRQAWMRDYLIEQGNERLPFIGSITRRVEIEKAASRIRSTLLLAEDWHAKCDTWAEALRTLRYAAEDIGVLVAVNSIVGMNTHRPLDSGEFRGFVLPDDYAPLVFLNGADTKSAQMFTLAHELAHLWLGCGGLFNLMHMQPYDDEREKYCNRVAAEFLIPAGILKARWKEAAATENPYKTAATWFKVSPLVAARRALDLKLISQSAFSVFYKRHQEEWDSLKTKTKEQPGGDSYKNYYVRLGRRFSSAVVCAALEGRLSYRDAYQLTGLKGKTFDKFAARVLERSGNG